MKQDLIYRIGHPLKKLRRVACSAKFHLCTRIYGENLRRARAIDSKHFLVLGNEFQFSPRSTGSFDNFVLYGIASVKRCTKWGLCWVNSALNRYTEKLCLNRRFAELKSQTSLFLTNSKDLTPRVYPLVEFDCIWRQRPRLGRIRQHIYV